MESNSKIKDFRSLSGRQAFIIFTGALLAVFLSSLDQTIVGTSMPRIVADLGGFAHYTWVTTVYLITFTVVVPITGKLTDMYGRKLFYIIGLIFFAVASLFCGLSNTMTQIIIWRGVQGIGAGIMMANAVIVIGDLFPPLERGKYQGIVTGVFGLSSIIGPMLGGFLTDTFSWHYIFFFNIPLTIIVILLFILFFPNIRPDTVKHRVDYPGVVTFILAIVPLMLALTWGGTEYPWVSIPIIGIFTFSAAMVALFLWIENKSAEPLIPLSLFKNRVVAVSEMMIFLNSFSMFCAMIFIPLFIQGVMGRSAASTGSFLVPMMLGLVAGSFASGQLLSRAGGHYKVQGAIGLVITGVGMLLLFRMGPETSNTAVLVSITLLGFGFGAVNPLYTIAIQNAVPYNILGTATSSAVFFRSIGGSIGLAIFGSILNNRFSSEFMRRLPEAVKEIVPAERLARIAHNPQALVNIEAQAQLRSEFGSLGQQGAAFFDQILQALRQALSSALSQVFLIALLIVALAFITNFFIREVPLHKTHRPPHE